MEIESQRLIFKSEKPEKETAEVGQSFGIAPNPTHKQPQAHRLADVADLRHGKALFTEQPGQGRP